MSSTPHAWIIQMKSDKSWKHSVSGPATVMLRGHGSRGRKGGPLVREQKNDATASRVGSTWKARLCLLPRLGHNLRGMCDPSWQPCFSYTWWRVSLLPPRTNSLPEALWEAYGGRRQDCWDLSDAKEWGLSVWHDIWPHFQKPYFLELCESLEWMSAKMLLLQHLCFSLEDKFD